MTLSNGSLEVSVFMSQMGGRTPALIAAAQPNNDLGKGYGDEIFDPIKSLEVFFDRMQAKVTS